MAGTDQLPPEVLRALSPNPDVAVVGYRSEPITGSSGAATGAITRLSGRLRHGGDDDEQPFSVVRKSFRPVTSGRHAGHADDPSHWAYWRREPLAYRSGRLPRDPPIVAPRCLGVVDDVVYLADVSGPPESAAVAAHRLGRWQATATIPDEPWMAGHQLAQRLAVIELDWAGVEAEPELIDWWARRGELLDRLTRLPRVLTHGDFSAGNLIAASATATVVIDWGTVGVGPVGADLASLALSTLDDRLDDHLDGLGGRFDRVAVELGYRATLVITGASRVHWMRTAGVDVPAGYEQFVLAQAP